MSAPVLRAASAPVITTGALTAPASTQVGDLVVCYLWSQGTNIPTHALQAGFFQWLSHSHDDGTTDARFSIAVKRATVAGAQSYTPYGVSGATASQTCGMIRVYQAGTWLDTLDSALTGLAVNSATSTNNAVPNPPSVAGLTGDYLVEAIGCWHVTTAGSTSATAMASYAIQANCQGPAGSHVTHLAVADRTLTGLSGATEDPAAFGDNVTPNGTVAATLAIPGAVSIQNWTQDAPGDAAASVLDPVLSPAPFSWSPADVSSAAATVLDPAFSAVGTASWSPPDVAGATASSLDAQFLAAGAVSWSPSATADAVAEVLDAAFTVPPQAFAPADVASAVASVLDPALSAAGAAPWAQDATAGVSATVLDLALVPGPVTWGSGQSADATATVLDAALVPGPVAWAADVPLEATAAILDPALTPGVASWAVPDVAEAVATSLAPSLEESSALTWGPPAPADAAADITDPAFAPGPVLWSLPDVATAAADVPGGEIVHPLDICRPGAVTVTTPCLNCFITSQSGTIAGD